MSSFTLPASIDLFLFVRLTKILQHNRKMSCSFVAFSSAQHLFFLKDKCVNVEPWAYKEAIVLWCWWHQLLMFCTDVRFSPSKDDCVCVRDESILLWYHSPQDYCFKMGFLYILITVYLPQAHVHTVLGYFPSRSATFTKKNTHTQSLILS